MLFCLFVIHSPTKNHPEFVSSATGANNVLDEDVLELLQWDDLSAHMFLCNIEDGISNYRTVREVYMNNDRRRNSKKFRSAVEKLKEYRKQFYEFDRSKLLPNVFGYLMTYVDGVKSSLKQYTNSLRTLLEEVWKLESFLEKVPNDYELQAKSVVPTMILGNHIHNNSNLNVNSNCNSNNLNFNDNFSTNFNDDFDTNFNDNLGTNFSSNLNNDNNNFNISQQVQLPSVDTSSLASPNKSIAHGAHGAKSGDPHLDRAFTRYHNIAPQYTTSSHGNRLSAQEVAVTGMMVANDACRYYTPQDSENIFDVARNYCKEKVTNGENRPSLKAEFLSIANGLQLHQNHPVQEFDPNYTEKRKYIFDNGLLATVGTLAKLFSSKYCDFGAYFNDILKAVDDIARFCHFEITSVLNAILILSEAHRRNSDVTVFMKQEEQKYLDEIECKLEVYCEATVHILKWLVNSVGDYSKPRNLIQHEAIGLYESEFKGVFDAYKILSRDEAKCLWCIDNLVALIDNYSLREYFIGMYLLLDILLANL